MRAILIFLLVTDLFAMGPLGGGSGNSAGGGGPKLREIASTEQVNPSSIKYDNCAVDKNSKGKLLCENNYLLDSATRIILTQSPYGKNLVHYERCLLDLLPITFGENVIYDRDNGLLFYGEKEKESGIYKLRNGRLEFFPLGKTIFGPGYKQGSEILVGTNKYQVIVVEGKIVVGPPAWIKNSSDKLLKTKYESMEFRSLKSVPARLDKDSISSIYSILAGRIDTVIDRFDYENQIFLSEKSYDNSGLTQIRLLTRCKSLVEKDKDESLVRNINLRLSDIANYLAPEQDTHESPPVQKGNGVDSKKLGKQNSNATVKEK